MTATVTYETAIEQLVDLTRELDGMYLAIAGANQIVARMFGKSTSEVDRDVYALMHQQQQQ